MKRGTTPLKRKPRKRRAAGTGCQIPKCRRLVYRTLDVRRCVIHAADKLVGDWVKARDGGCVRCGSEGPLDWAHVVSRRYKAVRWSVGAFNDPWNNSVAFCRPCHYWQTMNPLEGKAFFVGLGLDLTNLEYLALHDPPMDPHDVIERYEAAA
jgi:5-methylcytosine-specific restriction endonuclease McrA